MTLPLMSSTLKWNLRPVARTNKQPRRRFSPGDFFFNLYKKNETALHELSYLFWECTRRCNLNCRHCGSDCGAGPGVASGDMPFEDFLAAARPLVKHYGRGRITVAVTGGEPLLRPDLPDCGRKLREEGFLWGMVTNGFAYTQETHARLLAAGMGSLTVSLDGLPATHNWLRRNGESFSRAFAACRLAAASPGLNFDVVTCVHRRNLEELPALKGLLAGAGVRAWRLFTIAPIGRAAGEEVFALTGEELRRLMDFIARCRAGTDLPRVTFSCEAFTGGAYEGRVREGGFFCRAGVNIASVLHDGGISACPNISRAFVQGNIYRDSFLEVWEGAFAAMRNREWMREGPCAACHYWHGCQGGAMHLRTPAHPGPLCCLAQAVEGIDG